jgi:D-alanyl-D-alanine carboxypeptidase/D-alanyl-D-alanine-endopeptidase (penicillin-binding protein 4)
VAGAEIKRIEGDVIVDDRLFDQAAGTGSGPGRLTPIIINDNLIDFEITPTTVGTPAQVNWRPQTGFVQIDARVDTVKSGEKVSIDVSSDGERITVRGTIPLGHRPFVTIHEVGDAASFARTLLIEALRRSGVEVSASSLTGNQASTLPAADGYGKLTKVAELESPPFSESAKLILKVSHNLHASTLPLLVAAKHGERTLGQGLRRQQEILKRIGVDTETISFGGGAGGDRADYITPRAAVQLLRAMGERPDFAVYRDALPILGQDGTLAGIVPADSPAYGKFQAKTGTLLWNNRLNGTSLLTSKALAGYGTCQSGREVAIALFVNLVHMPDASGTEKAGKTLGGLCEVLYKAL